MTSTPLRKKDVFRDVRRNIEEVMRDNKGEEVRDTKAIDSLAIKLTDMLMKQ